MPAPQREILSQIAEAIRTIRFGSVQITIHDSRVVQIEKAEKIRPDDTSGRTDRTTGGSRTGDGR